MFRNVLGWICVLVIASGLLLGCEEDVVESVIIDADDISNARDAERYLVGVYDNIVSKSLFPDAFLIMPLLFSDDAMYTGSQNSDWKEASNFDLTPDNDVINDMLTDFYSINSNLNTFFDEIDTTVDETLTEEVKDGFRGEARAIRGMLYFYLTNYWGEVPLILEASDLEDENSITNATLEEIFTEIESDLIFAVENISKNSSNSGNQRLNEWSAKAFLARLYLYNGDWSNALMYAEQIIASNEFDLESSPEDIYRLNSQEHIWVLPGSEDEVSLSAWFLQTFTGGQHVVKPRQLLDADTFVVMGMDTIYDTTLVIGSLNKTFESGDKRRSVALNASGGTIVKYTNSFGNSDPIYMIRFAEMYLIAAEAAARLNDFGLADQYLNIVRNRAGLTNVTLDGNNFIDVIFQERNVELCYEGFYRMLDLKRSDIAAEGDLSYWGYDIPKDNLWPFSTLFDETFNNLEQNFGY